MGKTLDNIFGWGIKLVAPIILTAGILIPQFAKAQYPVSMNRFSRPHEVVNYAGSYGSGDVDQDGDVDWDDYNAMDTTQNFYSDVDADDVPSTTADKQHLADFLNGVIPYLQSDYDHATPGERKNWIEKIYPIMKRLNNYTYNSSSDPNLFFDSDRFALGDYFSGNGYNPNRDDFNIIHPKFNLNYNGLFDLPFCIARVHSDDNQFHHGLSLLITGNNIEDLESIVFVEPQNGRIVKPGETWSLPYNCSVDVYGIHNFKDTGDGDEPRLDRLMRIKVDDTGGMAITYLSPDPELVTGRPTVGVEGGYESIPRNYSLKQNYPNPFNPTTTIPYTVNKGSRKIRLEIYNIEGRKIQTLEQGVKDPGKHEVTWHPPQGLPSGMYFYQLGDEMGIIDTKKMIYTK
ncbi:T9SS type A sorting domain-containing protein [Nanoarchaeota archaeon]